MEVTGLKVERLASLRSSRVHDFDDVSARGPSRDPALLMQ